MAVTLSEDRETVPVEMRRSSRVLISVPIKISGVDSDGRQFSERTQTVVVSKHGAVIVSRHDLQPGAEIELTAFGDRARSRARVVRIAGQEQEQGVWHVAAELAQPSNFWRIHFPPEDWSETPGHPGRTEEDLAGLRPRPTLPPIPRVTPEVLEPDPASNVVREVEAAVMNYATESLLSSMTAEDQFKRYQLVVGAMLRALMRWGLLSQKELTEALKSAKSELSLGRPHRRA